MLLSPVGKPISYPTTSHEARVLFDMLWQLHSAGMAHGDPRVPNMIVMDEQRLWIDLYELWDASPTLMQNDAKILTKSILHVSSKDLLDSELESLINNYGTIPPIQANLNLLADKVGEKLEEVPRLDS
ncbi:hypothetical protein GN958_ATG03263 [Phytophthora infestans]|uniref:Uncharacterized protein n=1 Tax=Phytophthora infestans TaxID=4787 RepID=A0A8S9V844_PHYIN|nr:hypothetical protein GN958_ATG03263 [Phytophthora infestans]